MEIEWQIKDGQENEVFGFVSKKQNYKKCYVITLKGFQHFRVRVIAVNYFLYCYFCSKL